MITYSLLATKGCKKKLLGKNHKGLHPPPFGGLELKFFFVVVVFIHMIHTKKFLSRPDVTYCWSPITESPSSIDIEKHTYHLTKSAICARTLILSSGSCILIFLNKSMAKNKISPYFRVSAVYGI